MTTEKAYYYYDNNIKDRPINARYRFVLSYVKNKIVLDLGCGARRGPWILSEAASKVVGLDISPEAISYCSRKWPKDNISYLAADATKLPFPDKSFDVIVSFEVIEHLEDYQAYLAEVHRVLKLDGIFIISTPNRLVSSPEGIFSNPDHVREFDLKELKSALNKHFSDLRLYGQSPSDKAIKAKDLLNQVYHNLDKIPNILRKILPKDLKRYLRNKYIAFSARIKALPNPNLIKEEDYLFEEDKVEQASHLLAICRK